MPEDLSNQLASSQFHYDLGIMLYIALKGHDLGQSVLHIADQINHGVPPNPNLIHTQLIPEIAEVSTS